MTRLKKSKEIIGLYKRSKAFTLIELIVVMAIIGILVLLAAPRFIGQTEKAIFTKHISNARNVEDASERYFIAERDWPRLSDEAYTASEIEAYAETIFSITGEEMELDPDGDYFDIDYDALSDYVRVDASDKANYILQNPVGKVYYLDGLSESGRNRVDFDSSGEVVEDENEIPDYYVQATDEDFEYVKSQNAPNGTGYYQYIGSEFFVILPNTINGSTLTDTYRMFATTNVKGVAGDVSTLKSTNYMFLSSQAQELDLMYLNTSNVTSMEGMFWGAIGMSIHLGNLNTSSVTDMSSMFRATNANTLDLSNFDTSKVDDMSAMFYQSRAEELNLNNFDTINVLKMNAMFTETRARNIDLSSFDTTNVTTMRYMFWKSQAKTLDLSSFDTSDVGVMSDMFRESSIENGYARTESDADRFNNSSGKPGGLNFIVKP